MGDCIDMTRINDKDYELEYHWIWELADNGWADWICPVCGYTKNLDIHVDIGKSKCPECGTRLRKDD
jgi:rubrerythrin